MYNNYVPFVHIAFHIDVGAGFKPYCGHCFGRDSASRGDNMASLSFL